MNQNVGTADRLIRLLAGIARDYFNDRRGDHLLVRAAPIAFRAG